MDSIFSQVGVVTIAAAILAILARVLKQPIILAYIVAGILLGGSGLNVIPNASLAQDIATIGIIFLLFLVGLELDVGKIRKLGSVVIITGLVQMAVVGGAGYAITLLLGYSPTTAAYLGLATAFSSTAVVLKRLGDRHDLSSLHAKVTIGILLLQDVVAIFALMVISGAGTGGLSPLTFGLFALKGVLLFAGTYAFTKWLLGPLFFYIAKSTELLFMTSLGWAFLFAIIAEALGFSKEIGAFLAGLSLATLPYNFEIIGRVRPLKDFFLVIFFVVLGLQVSWAVVAANLPLLLLLSALVVVGKSLVTSLAMIRLGYPKRPAYLTGSALGQMSEFSLLVVILGVGFGHLPAETVALTAALLVLTITLNTYWNAAGKLLYPVLSRPLGWLGGKVRSRELSYRPPQMSGRVLMFGANRMGFGMLKTLESLKHNVLVVDHNPEVIRRLLKRGVESVYGDIDDLELLREMGLGDAKMVISTVPNPTANLYLLEETRHTNRRALVILTAEQIEDALAMYAAGADYVILPRLLGGEQAAQILRQVESHEVAASDLATKRSSHISYLKAHRSDLLA